MANQIFKVRPLSVVVQQGRETLAVTAVALSAGNAFAETRATTFVELINLSGITSIEYKVDSGAWVELTVGASAKLTLDLSTSTLRARRSGRVDLPASAQIFFDLVLVDGSEVQTDTFEDALVVVSDDAPNDSDGRPDGTIWLEV